MLRKISETLKNKLKVAAFNQRSKNADLSFEDVT